MAHDAVETKRRATYEDLLRVPDIMVAEIVDGELVVSPRPATPHAFAATEMAADLLPAFHGTAARTGPGGWWILPEPELHLADDVLVPDLAAWRCERMPVVPNAPAIALAPDWLCEIVSPSSVRHDRIGKMRCYARAKRAGTGVDSTCLGNKQTQADTVINKADGGCPGTAAAIDAAVDNCLAAFLTDDSGDGACPSASAKAIATSGNRELRCQAKDITAPASFAGCNAREDGRTTTVLSAFGGRLSCRTIN